jgi:hypothetical protein
MIFEGRQRRAFCYDILSLHAPKASGRVPAEAFGLLAPIQPHRPPCAQADSIIRSSRAASTTGTKNAATSPITVSKSLGIFSGLDFRTNARHWVCFWVPLRNSSVNGIGRWGVGSKELFPWSIKRKAELERPKS